MNQSQRLAELQQKAENSRALHQKAELQIEMSRQRQSELLDKLEKELGTRNPDEARNKLEVLRRNLENEIESLEKEMA